MSTEEKNQDPETISENPVNVLFNTSSIAKKDVWEIDIVGILEMLLRILGKSGKKDLRVAGMAALSSSLIYRIGSIFASRGNGKKILTRQCGIKLLGIHRLAVCCLIDRVFP